MSFASSQTSMRSLLRHLITRWDASSLATKSIVVALVGCVLVGLLLRFFDNGRETIGVPIGVGVAIVIALLLGIRAGGRK